MPPQPIVVATSKSGSSSSHYSRSSHALHSSTDNYSQINPRGGPGQPAYNDYHRVEFEAPLSAELEEGGDEKHQSLQFAAQELARGRFSIDLSLDLEHELANMESPPVTPAYNSRQMTKASMEENGEPMTAKAQMRGRGTELSHSTRSSSVSSASRNELSPDPEILAHIVTQLRQSLAEMTKERDDLVKLLSEANMREAETQDALQAMTDKATAAEEERAELKKKMKEDEEQIVMLRAKVEESRRGLMRLQTENRRQSMAPIDVSRASSATLSSFISPPSSKRASFVPLTGSSMQNRPNGHRRISSVSDSSSVIPNPDLTPSPNVHAFNIAATEAALTGRPNRSSGFFGRPAELDLSLNSAAPTGSSPPSTTISAELEILRKELNNLKEELDTTKHELSESKEAQEASETCVKVLRDFIAENNIGAGGLPSSLKLPPLPALTTGQEESSESKKPNTGWGFKLWGGSAAVEPLRTSTVNNVPYSATVPVASPMISRSSMQPPASAAPIGAPPLSRKLGGFFSSRSSISSNHSREQGLPPLPQLQTNAATKPLSHRDSTYSYSDASSVAEPVSPGSDVHGLGSAGYAKASDRDALVVHTHEVTSLDGTPVRVSLSAVDLDGLR